MFPARTNSTCTILLPPPFCVQLNTIISNQELFVVAIVTHADVSRRARVFTAICLCFSAQYLKNRCGYITKLDIQMFHDESWKPIYFRVKGQGHQWLKHCRRGLLHCCECWLFLVASVMVHWYKPF